jgi:hypothetical protein
MSETNDDLEALLAEHTEKPTLNQTLEKMETQHVEQLAQAALTEYSKRVPADVGSMTDAQFEAFKRQHGI